MQALPYSHSNLLVLYLLIEVTDRKREIAQTCWMEYRFHNLKYSSILSPGLSKQKSTIPSPYRQKHS